MEEAIQATKMNGIKITRNFVPTNQSPYSLFEYERRKSAIKNPNGEIVFELNDVEVPKDWSQVATDILAQKYFRRTGVPKEDGTTGGETSVKEVVHRLAECWRSWGLQYGYFANEEDSKIFYDEVVYTLLGQVAAPNSPQWFNTGLYNTYGIKGNSQGHFYIDPVDENLKVSTSAYERPQTHACFILSVEDDLINEGGIMDLLVNEARIFKFGSGAGTNYSKIRGIHEKLSGGGYSSGLMSFLKVTDKAAGAIKSGGTTRRAAKMVCVDLDHPEVPEMVNWKLKEEDKVAALVAGGFSSDYEGEAYQTVSGQNVNLSVRISNEFFNSLKEKKNWGFTSRTSGETIKEVSAEKLWNQIAFAAWKCGDPGVQFDTTINEWHTCPEDGKIRASNPCSEYMFLDNTGCNLASINLRKFWNEEKQLFDHESFEHVCRIWTLVLEITNLMAQFPTKEIAKLSYEYRPIGLGFANLGGVLMSAGIPYDSDKGRTMAAAISSIMTGTAYKTSAEIASILGPFKHFHKNKSAMMRVMNNHRAAAHNDILAYEGLTIKPDGINEEYCPQNLLKASSEIWDEVVALGNLYGFRNAQATVVAPTGTIGLLMDCDTTGIEPDFSLVKFKKLSGGGYFKIVNNAVSVALRNLGYSDYEIKYIVNYILGTASFENAPYVNHETLKSKGFSKSDIQKLENAALSAFHINYVFSVYSLGEDCMRRINIDEKLYQSPDFNLLTALGFTELQIEEANKYVCGTMTIEGAPYLNENDLSVFDCANKCGPFGTRFLSPQAHINMMAAVQPFISGAISKTINFSNEATVRDIQENFEYAWKKGIKACTVYRDGSKFSQPLSSTDKKDQAKAIDEDRILEAITPELVLKAAQKIMHESSDTKFKRELSRVVEKKSLPDKRMGFTQKARIDGNPIYIRTGEYDDGTLGEIFIDMYKEGASYRSLLNCFAVAVSVGLQYGVPLEEFVEKFTFTRFEPSGNVEGQPYIKHSTSLLDFIFRMLAWEYLGREDLLHIKPLKPNSANDTNLDTSSPQSGNKKYENFRPHKVQTQEFLANMMGDAPVCNVCGHITIRNGTCYKCLNCGNSLGCS